MKEYLDIVDENGNPTGEIVERSVAHAQGVRHRTSHVWLVRKRNRQVQILLQKRAIQKESFPGCYDISSAGHIPAGDDYIGSAIRELQEELGITVDGSELIYCGDRNVVWDGEFRHQPFHERQVSRVFLLWLDLEEEDFHIDPNEVDSVRWIAFEECIAGVETGAFLNCIAIEELQMLYRVFGKNNL